MTLSRVDCACYLANWKSIAMSVSELQQMGSCARCAVRRRHQRRPDACLAQRPEHQLHSCHERAAAFRPDGDQHVRGRQERAVDDGRLVQPVGHGILSHVCGHIGDLDGAGLGAVVKRPRDLSLRRSKPIHACRDQPGPRLARLRCVPASRRTALGRQRRHPAPALAEGWLRRSARPVRLQPAAVSAA